ncbi:MAG TPA: DUF302 domain-containing protein [Gammaproteobacteria bacterium]|nr:DUF302 domain-containing protein [Gammaproteobacteria bacterium]
MKPDKFVGLIALFLLLVSFVADAVEPKIIGMAKVYSVKSDFESAKDALLDAIQGRGMVVSYTSHADAMLGRTAGAVGATELVYKHAEILLFCKADLSHNLVAASPHNIVMCPYSIAVYETKDEPGVVYYSYRSADDSKIPAVKLIQKLLDSVVNEAIEG